MVEEQLTAGWVVERHRGGAQELHDLDPNPGGRRLWVHEVDRPAVVLGSTQRIEGIEARVEALGMELVRRRSGGGAVTLFPGEQVWIDVVLPAEDPRWDDDVERATWWIGEAWARVLQRRVPEGRFSVHQRGVSDRELGRLACFAAMGPGEVQLEGRKVVGISQRRTRHLARFQCLVLLRWDPSALLQVLDADHDGPLRDALSARVATVPALDGWSAVEELARQLG